MGRPENPLPTGARNTAVGKLAHWLRTQRHAAGLTYSVMAQQAGCHATTLQRAAKGTGVPPLRVVEAYARACGANLEDARRLWRAARYEASTRRHGTPEPTRIDLIREMAELVPAMIDIYHRTGATLREFEQRAGAHSQLPHSTIHRILRRQVIPTRHQFGLWLDACGITGTQRMAWVHAWGRAQEALLPKGRPDPKAWNEVTFIPSTPPPSHHRLPLAEARAS
ncbi:helix-turn-helix domain-containing protein [Streptomyces sedi]|uniref:Helix-turn-helix domain-containing protein n=1 Tax=Streptomyces sedi TaxID=555059 RepID=A0A5C4UTU0_9ACTN|nr:helix-turn-helix transcriptional regulator [Streptomyces sedi]TNM27074.1 helix-turn-helix domain-containing protein [Streptomyces sedi]